MNNGMGVVINAEEIGKNYLHELTPQLLEQEILNHGLVILRGFEPSEDELMAAFARQLGPLLEWDFGHVLDLKIQAQPQNHIFSQGRVELHWDGAFANAVPRYNFFQCLQSSAVAGGGETTFLNTVKLLEALPCEQVAWLEDKVISYHAEKKAHYGGTIRVPLISTHPATGKRRIRFIEPYNEDNMEVNPVEAVVEGFSSVENEDFLRQLIGLCYDSEHFYDHVWYQGDYVLVDNNALLHGRRRFRGEGLSRSLKRIHIL